MNVSDILEHHGIKGQKWGIRHKPNSKTGRVSTDFKISNDLRKRPVSSLSNKQINTVNTRLNLEQNFRRLNPTTVERGKRRAQALLATAGIAVTAFNLLNSPAGKAAVSAGKKAIKKKL